MKIEIEQIDSQYYFIIGEVALPLKSYALSDSGEKPMCLELTLELSTFTTKLELLTSSKAN